MPEGFLSSHLVGGVRPGTVVRLAAPQGNFVLPDPAPASVLFLTAGSGITPVMSMLRTMLRRKQIGHSDIVHIHSAPSADDVMFAAELAELAGGHPGYRLTLRATRTEGRLDLHRLDEVVADWRTAPDLGVRAGGHARRRREDLGRSGAGGQPASGTLRRGRARPPPGRAAASPSRAAGDRCRLTRPPRFMEAGEQAGVLLPFGCRMGICHTCVVSLLDGRARDLRTGAEYEPGSRVQTCVTRT